MLFYFVYLVMIGLPAAASSWMLFVWVPSFRNVFRDFHTALPPITTSLLDLSAFCSQSYVWPFLILAVLLIPLPLAKLTLHFKTSTQRLTAAMMIMLILMLLTFSFWMFVQVALFMPMVSLMKSVSGGST